MGLGIGLGLGLGIGLGARVKAAPRPPQALRGDGGGWYLGNRARLELLDESGVRWSYGQREGGHVQALAVAEGGVGTAATQEADLGRGRGRVRVRVRVGVGLG